MNISGIMSMMQSEATLKAPVMVSRSAELMHVPSVSRSQNLDGGMHWNAFKISMESRYTIFSQKNASTERRLVDPEIGVNMRAVCRMMEAFAAAATGSYSMDIAHCTCVHSIVNNTATLTSIDGLMGM